MKEEDRAFRDALGTSAEDSMEREGVEPSSGGCPLGLSLRRNRLRPWDGAVAPPVRTGVSHPGKLPGLAEERGLELSAAALVRSADGRQLMAGA